MAENGHSMEGFGSFAEAIATLGKLTVLESKISAAIKTSKVPKKETRKLLKCSNAMEASNVPLFQFMQDIFDHIGLGKLELAEFTHFKHNWKDDTCPICAFYPTIKDKKTCYVIVDALSQFYVKDLDLPCYVKEIKCKSKGDETCLFEVSLQPLAVYQIALDDLDERIINAILNGETNKDHLAEAIDLGAEELKYRLDILNSFHILDDGLNVTEIGITFHKYKHAASIAEEDFEPPWRIMSEITSAISASSSFAEAFSETAEEDASEVDETATVNLADEAKKASGFAELLSKQLHSLEEKKEE